MSNRLLESNGSFTIVPIDQFADAVQFDGDADTDEVLNSVQDRQNVMVNFPTSADGRGFSLAATLRDSGGYTGKLYAVGQLNPDQVSIAFQCGFDGVVVDKAHWIRYGGNAWMRAVDPAVNRTYLRFHWDRLDPIWDSRTVAAPS